MPAVSATTPAASGAAAAAAAAAAATAAPVSSEPVAPIRLHPAASVRGMGPASGGGAVAPASFYCPISMELMADPVMVATGEQRSRIGAELQGALQPATVQAAQSTHPTLHMHCDLYGALSMICMHLHMLLATSLALEENKKLGAWAACLGAAAHALHSTDLHLLTAVFLYRRPHI